jgi:hypothetical protein
MTKAILSLHPRANGPKPTYMPDSTAMNLNTSSVAVMSVMATMVNPYLPTQLFIGPWQPKANPRTS